MKLAIRTSNSVIEGASYFKCQAMAEAYKGFRFQCRKSVNMACIPRVHAEGVFRIKLKTKDLYLELDSDSGKLKLVPREEAADSQLVRLHKVYYIFN